MKFNIGDKCKPIVGRADCASFNRNGGSYVVITDIKDDRYYYDIFNSEGANVNCCFGCLRDSDLELVSDSSKEEENKMRKTYRLLKDTPTVRKGAIYQLNANNEYWLITTGHNKFPLIKIYYTEKSMIETQPDWFEEIVDIAYLTKNEMVVKKENKRTKK